MHFCDDNRPHQAPFLFSSAPPIVDVVGLSASTISNRCARDETHLGRMGTPWVHMYSIRSSACDLVATASLSPHLHCRGLRTVPCNITSVLRRLRSRSVFRVAFMRSPLARYLGKIQPSSPLLAYWTCPADALILSCSEAAAAVTIEGSLGFITDFGPHSTVRRGGFFPVLHLHSVVGHSAICTKARSRLLQYLQQVPGLSDHSLQSVLLIVDTMVSVSGLEEHGYGYGAINSH